MQDLIKVDYTNETPTVDGRELHEFLEVKTPYRIWIARMIEYGFNEGIDFRTNLYETSKGGRPSINHKLTIQMAKELCMLQRSEKGKQARLYFLKLEDAWNSPEMVMKRALDFANKSVEKLKLENTKLLIDNTKMIPKAEYFDELVDRNLLTNFRETAKELKVKEKIFITFLIDNKYIYRDKKGKLMPTASKNNELFEIKESFNEKTNWSGTQTLITPKGRETFRLLMKSDIHK